MILKATYRMSRWIEYDPNNPEHYGKQDEITGKILEVDDIEGYINDRVVLDDNITQKVISGYDKDSRGNLVPTYVDNSTSVSNVYYEFFIKNERGWGVLFIPHTDVTVDDKDFQEYKKLKWQQLSR